MNPPFNYLITTEVMEAHARLVKVAEKKLGVTMNSKKRFLKGMHLKVTKGLYSHHGIYIGKKQVVHYSGKSDSLFDFSDAVVEITTLENFANGGIIHQVTHSSSYKKSDIVANALSRIGEKKYSLMFNNCEHFANWCVNGNEQSDQVDQVLMLTAATAIVASAAVSTKSGACTLGVLTTSKVSQASGSLLTKATTGAAIGGSTGSMLTGGAVGAASLAAISTTPLVVGACLAGGGIAIVGHLFDWW